MKINRVLIVLSMIAFLLVGQGTSVSANASAEQALRSPDGRALIESSDAAGNGEYNERNGNALESSFRQPGSVSVLPDGSIVVSDTGNHRLRLLKDGKVSVYAGPTISLLFEAGLPAGAYADGKANVSFFHQPMGIFPDAAGNFYIADSGNHTIRKLDTDGNVTTLAGSGVLGNKDGFGKSASFYAPHDIAVSNSGTIYVADTLNHVIRQISPDGSVSTLNTPSNRVIEFVPGVVETAGDYVDGPLAMAKFNEPMGLAIDRLGNLYVSDAGNQRIRYIDFQKNQVSTVAGSGNYRSQDLYVEGGYQDGAFAQARFNNPRGIAVDANGGLYIADSLNHSIRYLRDGIVTTVVGNPSGEYGATNGIDEYVLVDRPYDVAVMPNGNLVIADTNNNKIRMIRYFTLPSGWKANGKVRVLYKNTPIVFDAEPMIRNSRTLVPVRKIAEALGYEVEFAGNDIFLKGPDRTISMTVGKQAVTRIVKDKLIPSKMDVSPIIEDQRTYVPVRFFAEEIGIEVDWHEPSTTVILREKTK
jgi:sugar lactone lactonase YvrE